MAERVVFWDFDGTLAQRDGLFAGALVDALRLVDATVEIDRENVRPHLRTGFPWHTPEAVTPPLTPERWWAGLRPVFERAYRACGVDDDIAAAAASGVAGQFYRRDAWALIDGAADALDLVRDAGYTNVILSNHGPELPELVHDLGLRVDATITSAALGMEKPNPLLFRYALDMSDAGADTWMIGDNPVADVQGAEAAGIRAILADGVYPDSRGVTVLEAARIVAASA
ncbi:MAG TPA: HAD-IA family hydrolase [Microbacterium sp.]|nr:HAD-IA family hydrolase [Microbacterium sp.]